MRCAETNAAIDASVRGDACNRAGDCYFYARRFDEARAQYAKAVSIEPSYGDYSLFQEAFVKGLQRDYTGKIETLNILLSKYPSSQYIDDALYEQGRAFVQMEQADNIRSLLKNGLKASWHARRQARLLCFIIRMTNSMKLLPHIRRLLQIILEVRRQKWLSVT